MPISFIHTEPPRPEGEEYSDGKICTYPMKSPDDRVDKICGAGPARPVHPVGADPRGWPMLALCRDHDTSVPPRSIGWTPDGE